MREVVGIRPKPGAGHRRYRSRHEFPGREIRHDGALRARSAGPRDGIILACGKRRVGRKALGSLIRVYRVRAISGNFVDPLGRRMP